MAIDRWRAREVMAATRAEVAENMEIAAKLVETEARRNLLHIREPEFGRAYRKVLALYRLTSQVDTERDLIMAQIGIPAGVKGDSYGFWIEVGSRTAPAQPWLRPALVHNLSKIMGILEGR